MTNLKLLSLLAALSISGLIACKSGGKTESTDTTATKVSVPKQPEIPTDTLTLPKDVLGVWTTGRTNDASFEIRKDSVYYPGEKHSFKYVLKKDSIKIFYEDYVYSGRVYFVKDTMNFSSPVDGPLKMWPFKGKVVF